MIDYEILMLLDPELDEAPQAEVVARVRGLIEKDGGTLARHDVWGKRKLAYEIDKKADAHYHLLLFSCSAGTLDEISRVLKIDDNVMRHLATRRLEGGPTEPLPVGAPESHDAVIDDLAEEDED